ncbi:TIGR03016 family PEP-CTERM system-associated outer membrane protein [Falsiroseomonas sp.]|uniref:TIGR03016 family PEP-CTERM system-associated outer membrane protein n=1 Tax=Falsiroseomonas sp. TaxID=2870721 RepID=UPI00272022F0|nr:TIGR03016 family PEP-CTERM system-associated outer membrane protein [Falsiroseomonas sp.]MDO9502898.1 TIGR03016 family PEP-CTERM system-associated outer membrane protein [Falsiroseomonas sp.]MDP3414428.1 TIGR03016 family PEP-CTERM system-associated outer membrane protein [Falsiroseomonas sp.]
MADLLLRGAVLALGMAAVPAWATSPPLPGSTGPGSLPSVRAAAEAEGAAARGVDLVAPTAPPIRIGQFGFPTTGPLPAAPGPARAWTIVPSLTVQAVATDNLTNSGNRKSGDVFTTITPGVLVSADTARLQGVLNYTPTARFHANNTDQDRFDQNFNGQALVSVVPGTLFLDMRGSSSIQSVNGGFAPEGSIVTDDRDRLQTTSFQISPYIVHRFGDTATMQVGYAYQWVDQSGDDPVLALQPGQFRPGVQGGTAAQSFTAHEGYAVVRTGPDFGRLALEGRLQATAYDGDGVLDGAYRRLGSVEARYAILRGLSVLVMGGYEQQRFGGTPGIDIDEPIWSVGTRFDFSEASQVTVRYGRRNGFNSLSFDGSVAVGGRTRISGRYAETLSTGALQAADLLSTTSLDQFGNPVDLSTGLPVVRPFSGSFLGSQNNLARIKTASAAIVQTWPRDTFALTLTREERTPVSVAEGGSSFGQRGTSAGFTWSRSLTPRTTAVGFLQYGRSSNDLRGDGTIMSASLTFVHALRENTTATLQLASRRNDASVGNGTSTQNFILIGLRQTF